MVPENLRVSAPPAASGVFRMPRRRGFFSPWSSRSPSPVLASADFWAGAGRWWSWLWAWPRCSRGPVCGFLPLPAPLALAARLCVSLLGLFLGQSFPLPMVAHSLLPWSGLPGTSVYPILLQGRGFAVLCFVCPLPQRQGRFRLLPRRTLGSPGKGLCGPLTLWLKEEKVESGQALHRPSLPFSAAAHLVREPGAEALFCRHQHLQACTDPGGPVQPAALPGTPPPPRVLHGGSRGVLRPRIGGPRGFSALLYLHAACTSPCRFRCVIHTRVVLSSSPRPGCTRDLVHESHLSSLGALVSWRAAHMVALTQLSDRIKKDYDFLLLRSERCSVSVGPWRKQPQGYVFGRAKRQINDVEHRHVPNPWILRIELTNFRMRILCSIWIRIHEKIKVNIRMTQTKSISLKLKCILT